MRHRQTTRKHSWRTVALPVAMLGALAAGLYVGTGHDDGSKGSAASTGNVPAHGSGTFTPAVGGSAVAGKGRPLRYTVDVEDGIGQDPKVFAKEVERILADPRGWTKSGAAFQRVDRPPYAFTVHLASPTTTDELCNRYGLDTGGEVNCQGGSEVVVNLKRWLLLSPYYRGRPETYHALIINHEVGHRLGRGHEGCPSPGSPAPVMMQQIKGLHGCRPNAWPYDRDGRPLGGPAAP
ncbi:DUF3152 domain-containing protein [Streptomyces sp. NPDC054794]